MSEINKGDVVVLKSGGPVMTVLNVVQRQHDTAITCIWFSPSQELKSENFSIHVLKIAE